MTRYIIMANGKGVRWNNFENKPKHLIEVNGETLLRRIVRLLKKYDAGCEVIITSDDPRYEVEGAHRHAPLDNQLEIDRFTYELIEDHICFLYGDTYYTDEAIQTIVQAKVRSLLFIGTEKRIVALKAQKGSLLKLHINKVKQLFLDGEIKDCKGWQVYQSFMGLPYDKIQVTGNYVLLNDQTQDFNYPEDYLGFLETLSTRNVSS